ILLSKNSTACGDGLSVGGGCLSAACCAIARQQANGTTPATATAILVMSRFLNKGGRASGRGPGSGEGGGVGPLTIRIPCDGAPRQAPARDFRQACRLAPIRDP